MSGLIGGAGRKSGVINTFGQYMRGGWAMFDGVGDQGTDWHLIISALGSGNWPDVDKDFGATQPDYGTYPTSAPYVTVNMWKKFDVLDPTKFMFMTGDQSRWFQVGASFMTTSQSSAVNFPYLASSGSNLHHATIGTYLRRSNLEDPWVDGSDGHANYTFWGENNNANNLTVKNTYGGIFIYAK